VVTSRWLGGAVALGAVLDPRLRTARYGAFLARSMPGLWPTRDRDVVLGALSRLAVMD